MNFNIDRDFPRCTLHHSHMHRGTRFAVHHCTVELHLQPVQNRDQRWALGSRNGARFWASSQLTAHHHSLGSRQAHNWIIPKNSYRWEQTLTKEGWQDVLNMPIRVHAQRYSEKHTWMWTLLSRTMHWWMASPKCVVPNMPNFSSKVTTTTCSIIIVDKLVISQIYVLVILFAIYWNIYNNSFSFSIKANTNL